MDAIGMINIILASTIGFIFGYRCCKKCEEKKNQS